MIEKRQKLIWESDRTKESYTDDEVNELAEWFDELTLRQAFFLKQSYEGYLCSQSHSCGNGYVQ